MRGWIGLGLLGWVGCAGDADDGTPTDGVDAPTFTEVYDTILKPSCAISTCHSVGSGNGMELDDAGAWAALVDAPSLGAPGEILVVASDPDGSYLIQKMEGATGIAGSPMPPPFGGQDPADVQALRDWIAAGALDN